MITVQGRFRNSVLRVADRILSAVLRPGPAPARPARPRVLIVRCDHLGDAVVSTAVLQGLRDALQPSRMDMACGPWAAAVFDGHPAVDDVLCVATPWWRARDRVGFWARARAWIELAAFALRIRKMRYDVGIDLRGDIRHFVWFFWLGRIPERISSDRTGGTAFLTSCVAHDESVPEVARTFAIAANVGSERPGRPALTVQELPRPWREAVGLPSRFMAITPRGTSPNREWPAECVADLARLVRDRYGIPLVYLGGDADRPHAQESGLAPHEGFVNLAGKTTVGELIAVLAEAELVVAMDSGPMHIAAALGRPVVALWGPTPSSWLPLTDDLSVVRPSVACPCTGRVCRFTSGAGNCFRSITALQVFAAVQERFAANR